MNILKLFFFDPLRIPFKRNPIYLFHAHTVVPEHLIDGGEAYCVDFSETVIVSYVLLYFPQFYSIVFVKPFEKLKFIVAG